MRGRRRGDVADGKKKRKRSWGKEYPRGDKVTEGLTKAGTGKRTNQKREEGLGRNFGEGSNVNKTSGPKKKGPFGAEEGSNRKLDFRRKRFNRRGSWTSKNVQ